MMRAIVTATLAASAIAIATAVAAQQTRPATAVVDVWPEGRMPGRPATQPESERPSRDAFHRITNVSRPTLAFHPTTRPGAPAVIVCPGGGYSYVVIDKEGSEIATWLNANGYAALVLKYRTPNNRAGAFQDVQRAIRVARANAAEWKIDARRIGVIGFSAGGHLAARTSARFDEPSYAAIDAVDDQSARPDFAILVYPAYLGRDGKVSTDVHVTPEMPPMLIVHSDDDRSFIEGSRLFHAALGDAGVAHDFLCYPTGGHGYGLHCAREARAWPRAAIDWLGTHVDRADAPRP